MVRTTVTHVGCLLLLASFLLAVPSDAAQGEQAHAFWIITLQGTIAAQRNTSVQRVDVGQSYILDPTADTRQTIRFHHGEHITERLVGQLDLVIEHLPRRAYATVHGAARLLLSDREGNGDIAMLVPVETTQIAPTTNHTVADAVTEGQHTLRLDLTISSQPFTCDPAADADCDTLPDALEAALVDRFKPALVFADDEPVPPGEMTAVYQVSPRVLDPGGRTAVMITIVVLYTQDEGVHHLTITGWNHLTCNLIVIGQERELGLPLVPAELLKMPINAHCGDSETMRALVTESEDNSGLWALAAVYLRQHDGPWHTVAGDAVGETFTFDPAGGAGSDRVVLYVSRGKHSMYPDPAACAAYQSITPVPSMDTWKCSMTFEECGTGPPVQLETPVTHNVGERHRPAFDIMAESASPVLRALFPGEYAWTEEAFCGGFSDIPEPAYGMGAWCGGSLASKWWPPAP